MTTDRLNSVETGDQSYSLPGLKISRLICPPPSESLCDPVSAVHSITVFMANAHLPNSDTLARRLDGGKWQRSQSYPGKATFVPAGCSPTWRWEETVELLELKIKPEWLRQVALTTFDKEPQQIELLPRFSTHDPFIEQLAIAFKAEVSRKTANKLHLESLQNVLAVHLLRSHCTIAVKHFESSTNHLSSKQLKTVTDYVQDCMNQDLTLANLAEVAGTSAYQFNRQFKQRMGLSPHRYVTQCRLEKAKALLADSNLSIAEIAQQVGFYDQSHFTHTFKKRTALTPQQYRTSC